MSLDTKDNVAYDTGMNKSTNKSYINLLHQLRIKHRDLSTATRKDHQARELDVYQEMVTLFYKKNGHYPVATEFTHENLLPSARLIQRNYGGLKKFRETMNLPITDYASGTPRTDKMKIISQRALQYEQELFILIHKKFHHPDYGFVVEREPVISGVDPENDTYGYKRADVAIHDYNFPRVEQKTSTYIDFFFASTKESLFGCVNIKNKKIKNLIPTKDITFVSVNPKFSQTDIDLFTLPKNSPKVLSLTQFKKEFLS